jgi:hypothetical protein
MVLASCSEQNFQLETTPVAIDFSDKILVTRPTTFYLGRGIGCIGIIAISVGIITYFTGDFLIPALAWCALGIPITVIGGIFMRNGITKN